MNIPLSKKARQQLEQAEKLFKETLFLEVDDNSGFDKKLKKISQSFFEQLFSPNGLYWQTYAELGLAHEPPLSNIVFIQGQIYHLKNLEEQYVHKPGMISHYSIINGLIQQKKTWNFDNILLLLSTPFDLAKQSGRRLRIGLYANESIDVFEQFKQQLQTLVESTDADALQQAVRAESMALQAMAFSNIALLCHQFKIKIKSTPSLASNEQNRLAKLVAQQDWQAIQEDFWYFSNQPYDISCPRYAQDISALKQTGNALIPESLALNWRENAKHLCAKALAIERAALLKHAQTTGLGELIWHLSLKELQTLKKKEQVLLAQQRKNEFEMYTSYQSKLYYDSGKLFSLTKKQEDWIKLTGKAVGGSKIARGRAVWIHSTKDYAKITRGSIIITKTLLPELCGLFSTAEGVISETGSLLSHAAIVAREQGIPCLVQVSCASLIKENDPLSIEGGSVVHLGKIPARKSTATLKTSVMTLEPELIATNYVVCLSQDKVIGVGQKAKNLSLLATSLPVPQTFIITNKFFVEYIKPLVHDLLSEIHQDQSYAKLEQLSQKISRRIVSSKLPSKLTQDIMRMLSQMKANTFAVRSSSTAEDLEGLSFAGQLDSFLNVSSPKQILEAIRDCWVSLYSTRAIRYRLDRGMGQDQVSLAVIVQAMVKAKCSGVMFTKNPQNNKTLIIEAVKGTADVLVSGKAKPNSYEFSRETRKQMSSSSQGPLSSTQASKLAQAGFTIEQIFSSPQDIEWAIDQQGKIWILQSRPITS